MLLWKEWRQQRWTLLGMTALALGLFVLGGTLLRRWSFGLSGAAHVFALLGVPLVLSARAFAGEDEDGTALFLRELPFRPWQVFVAKFVVVVLASWAAGVAVLLLGRLWQGYPDNPVKPVWPLLCLLWPVASVTASFSALLAALPLRSLATALLAAVLLATWGVLGWFSLVGLVGVRVLLPWLLVVLAGEVGLAILAAGGLAARRHPRALVQALRSLGGCAGVVLVCPLPGLLSYLYLDVLATPAAYLRGNALRRALGWISISVPHTDQPAGVVLQCQPYGSRYGAAALLDPATGRCTWVDRLPLGFGQRAGTRGMATWSPDGHRASWVSTLPKAADETPSLGNVGVHWHPPRASVLPWLDRPDPPQPVLCVYDLATQRLARLPNMAWSLSDPYGGNPWYDPQWLATVTVERNPAEVRVSFVDADDGRRHACTVPVEGAAADWERVSVAMALGRAVCVAIRQPSAGSPADSVVVALTTPEAAAARLVQVRGQVLEGSRLRSVSPDARWALFEPLTWDDPDARLDLVDLDSGDSRAVELPAGARDFEGYQRRSVQVCGFVAGGKGLLVSSLGTLGLYDLERHAWVTYLPPQPQLTGYSGQPVTVSPDGRRALLVFVGGGARQAGDSATEPRRGTFQWINQIVRRAGLREADAVVVELATGQMSSVHLADFGGEPGFTPGATWFGNDHILVLSASGLCRYGLDGSREVLYP
jgi:hypothetical protein